MNKKTYFFSILLIITVLCGTASFIYAKNKPVVREVIKQTPRPEVVSTTTKRESTPASEVSNKDKNYYQLFAEDLEKERRANTSTIAIQFFGDIMLDRNVAKNMGATGLDYLFENFYGEDKGLYHHADLVVANLEGPFATTRVPTNKSIAFRFDPSLGAQLKKYKFDGFSLANNHTLDMGKQNVEFTRQTLKNNDLGFFGHQTKEDTNLTWVASIPGKPEKVAFIGLNNTDHALDMPKVFEAIKDAKEKVQYVIVFIHWGVEYERTSKQAQQNLAHLLVDKGVDAVIGAHPHVVEEAEVYKEKPIFYSLGNFIFDQYFSQDTQEGISVGLVFQSGKIKNVYVFPFYGVKSQVRLMEGNQRIQFIDWLNKNSRLGEKKFENGKITI